MKLMNQTWTLLKRIFLVYVVVNVCICIAYLYHTDADWRKQKNEKGALQELIFHQNYRNRNKIKHREIEGNSKRWPGVNLARFDLPLLGKIMKGNHTFCNGKYTSYYGYFSVLRQVVVDKNQSLSHRGGGENISDVLRQSEQEEFIKLKHGFFEMVCEFKPKNTFFGTDGHLNWEDSLKLSRNISTAKRTERAVTYALVRYEYANLYWVLVDLYDVFFLTTVLGLNPYNTHILIVDLHPFSILDRLWWTVFPKVTRIGLYNETVMFDTLVWGLNRRHCPLLKNGSFKRFPFLEEFRHFVLSKTTTQINTSGINCNNVSVTIILRRNYIAHARNPSGIVGRKIANEKELLDNVSKALKGHSVTAVQLDVFPIEEQIRLTSRTDILVGMHGAGLSHVMFLPVHAALIELFPISQTTLSHFEFIARWRKIIYAKWKNNDTRREIDNFTTKVDEEKVVALVLDAYRRICPK